MSIEFTQYVLPDGRRRLQWIDMPEEIETMARRFINAGGWYESEMLGDMRTVSLTACWERENGDNGKLLRYSVFVNGALAAKLDSFDVACALARAWSSDTASRGLADVVSKTGIVAQFGRGRATAEFAHVTVASACELWLGGHTERAA